MFLARKAIRSQTSKKNSLIKQQFTYLSSKRDIAGVIRSDFPDIDIPNTTIPEYIFENFLTYPNKIAVECSLTEKKFTFDEVLCKSRNLSGALRQKLKLNPGDVVAVLLPNMPDYPICVFGSLMASLKVTTINPIYTPTEISVQLEDTNVKALFTLMEHVPKAQASMKLTHRRVPIIGIKMREADTVAEGAIDMREFVNTKTDIQDFPSADSNDTALLFYSSGTTGLPKGVELTHRNIISNVMQSSDLRVRMFQEATAERQDVVPVIVPIFHIFGFSSVLLVHLHKMCKMVTMPKFDAHPFVELLARHQPHILMLVPTIVNFMAKEPLVKKEYLESVRFVLAGGGPLTASDLENLSHKVANNVAVNQGYGLTETSPAVFMPSIRTRKLGTRGSVGELLSNTSVMLRKADNSDIIITSPNEPGELFVKGPQVMKGYYNRPEENKGAFLNGWFKTGDLAYYDENKLFFVTERLKELIKVKGYQVSPAELEGLLREHPDVLEAAVLGVPHERYGEAPTAYVIPRPNRNINIDNIHMYIAERAANYKHLVGGIQITDNIPKTASGKILRKELRKKYMEEIS
ncbi:hypothetical protein PPYR_00405 [Photinus pyralis]|uniref:AMP-dependent synthetase/ligase domain-containing protein n=1 Tax=Photinus pyralis TaxID=7054 RepID=A0A5N4B1G6_PHOPY|nr:4-coumarate--CoA ligase-like 7 [Photinus pyralis]XP_031328076.1 4-coumarate--CoA ligase-like 7 [Photinus pyralis]KAB0803435.1 hypothetical protein PPYR_00405 [Photinus pyralis]